MNTETKRQEGSDMMTVRQVAQFTERPLSSTYKWLHRQAHIPIHRIGRRIFVRRPDLLQMVGEVDREQPSSEQQESAAVRAEGQAGEVQQIEPAPEPPATPAIPANVPGRSGQKELRPRPTSRFAPLAIFTGFEFIC